MRTAKRCGLFVAAGAVGRMSVIVGTLVGVSCLLGAAASALVLAACNQDSYASTPERETHMGEILAAPEPSGTIRIASSAAVSAPPPAAPAPAPAAATPAPSSKAAP
jgi:hypothetical protein